MRYLQDIAQASAMKGIQLSFVHSLKAFAFQRKKQLRADASPVDLKFLLIWKVGTLQSEENVALASPILRFTAEETDPEAVTSEHK